jgi:hypothetical protein
MNCIASAICCFVRPLLACLLLLGGKLPAQGPSNGETALYRLMDSGFLKTYKDYRAEIEQYAALFKIKQQQYSPEEAVMMRSAYNRTSEAFEDFIYSVRNDLLDSKTRRSIAKDTEGYVRTKLESLNKVYEEYYLLRFKPTYVAICTPDTPVMASAQRAGLPIEIPLSLIAPVATATMQVIDFLDKKSDRDIETLKKVLEEEWIKPNRFTAWEQI